MNNCTTAASRREILAGIAGMSVAAVGGIGAAPAQAAAALGPGLKSTKEWHSGCTINKYSEFGLYRGHPIDTITTWCPHNDWSEIMGLKGGFRTAKGSGARISLALAALPRSHSGLLYPENWKRAAKGDYDTYYRTFASNLKNSGVTNVICRVAGWECNGRTRPWYCGTDKEAFKATFRRMARIVREYNPTVLIEWCNLKKGAQPGSIMDYYPGDDVVDIIGVNYYDGWPALNTQAIWDAQYYADYKGGPWGIGAWIEEVKRHPGKLFSCSEWAISVGISIGATDNALYIENMHQTFTDNAPFIAYENYFNQKPRHQLTPANVNPLSSAKYKQLWA